MVEEEAKDYEIEVWGLLIVNAKSKEQARVMAEKKMRTFDEYRIEHIS